MRVLILSGPTHEYLDPVRFIGNASSGLMGKAIAEAATAKDFDVKFITGPVAESNLPNTGTIQRVTCADEMLATASEVFDKADIIIFTAAVADYKPAEKQTEKMSKSAEGFTLKLEPTPDIAKTLCARKRDDQIAIGFALQTSEGEKNARRKLEAKNLDGIILNTPATLGAPTGTFSFLSKETDTFEEWGCISKTKCAEQIFRALETLSRER